MSEQNTRPEKRAGWKSDYQPGIGKGAIVDAPDVSGRELQRRAVVVGTPSDVPRAIQHPAVVAGDLAIVSALAIDLEANESAPELAALSDLLTRHEAGSVLIAGPVGATVMRRIADLALVHHCDLLAVMPTETLAEHTPVIVWRGDNPLVQLARPTRKQWEIAAKRAFDVTTAIVGLVITSPILAVLAAAVRLDSPGTVIFKHSRVGANGRRFNCLKLRTMRMDAEARLRNDPELYAEYVRNHFKIPEGRDPRTTRLGRWLRRTSLDELPQLWNVLVGDMSVVGPRPVVMDELAMYGTSAKLLLSIRPGITGAWAVSGRHEVGYPERCSIELGYVRKWTLGGDVGILVKTFGAIRQS